MNILQLLAEFLLTLLTAPLTAPGDAGSFGIGLYAATEQYLGGVGNLVAAALQTKGLIDQAKILTEFRETLEWIAALAWLFSIAMGIGSVAVFGNYRQAGYLLVGPALFFFMIEVTAPTDGTRTLVGNREVEGAKENQKDLLRWIRVIGDNNTQLGEDGGITGAGSVNVSYFFALFDSLVTEAIHSLVAVVMSADNIRDLRMVGRERALAFALDATPKDAALASLIVRYHLGECGQAMSDLSLQIHKHEKKPVAYRDQTDIENAKKKVENVSWNKIVPIDPYVKKYLGNHPEIFGEIPGADKPEDLLLTCEQIWQLVRTAVHDIAKKALDPKVFQGSFGADDQYPYEEQAENVRKWLEGENGTVDAESMLAVYVYKNMLVRSTHSSLQTQVFGRSPFNAQQYSAVFNNVAGAESWGGYQKIRYFASAIPYIQGLLLYLLSIAFPFFAMLLVVPGKATGIFVWCALWTWVKSWDLGFALVHVIRDVLWHMMKARVNIHDQAVDWDFPSSVLAVAFNNDPLFTQNTMIVIVAALMLMVPVLTAHLCLGAGQLYDAFRYGIDSTANRFGSREVNRGKRHFANEIEAQQRGRLHDAKMAIGKLAYYNPGRSADNPHGAQTIDGQSIPLMDLKQGALWGGLNGAPGARPFYAAAEADFAGYNILNGDSQYIRRLFRGVQTAEEIERGKNPEQGAGGETSGRAEFAVAHPLRGMMDPSMKIPAKLPTGEATADAIPEFKKLLANASPEEKARFEKGEMTLEEFTERERSIQHDLGDSLVAVTGRPQYGMMEGADAGSSAEAMSKMLLRRQANAEFSRAPGDGMDIHLNVILSGLAEYLTGETARPDMPHRGWGGDAWGGAPSPAGTTPVKGPDDSGSKKEDAGGDGDGE